MKDVVQNATTGGSSSSGGSGTVLLPTMNVDDETPMEMKEKVLEKISVTLDDDEKKGVEWLMIAATKSIAQNCKAACMEYVLPSWGSRIQMCTRLHEHLMAVHIASKAPSTATEKEKKEKRKK